MSAIDPAIQKMIENGRQAVAARDVQRVAERKAQEEAERQKWDAAWSELEAAVAQLLPKEIAKFVKAERFPYQMPGLASTVNIEIPHLHPFGVVMRKGDGGWGVHKYIVRQELISGGNDNYYTPDFHANQLHLCLAEVARLTEWQAARKAMQLDYEIAVSEWQQKHDTATAVIEAMTNSLQKDICEHYGASFALWQILYSYFDEDGGTETNTAVVLENETDALGFWRVVNKMGEVRRISFSSVYAIEALGDFDVTGRSYTKRLYGDKLDTIYLPPYVTETELAAAKRTLATADAAAPEFPERPRPHDMEAAVLFADWELDWLYHNTGGDAQE